MDIKEIVFMIYLFFINIYKNIIDSFNCKKVKVKEEVEEDESNNEHQLLLEELAEEVIERLGEQYYLFKKD
tara:strand:+ start:246 stop:458 length:213 start_codon:yes stop_codon:yes gene_type:complete